MTSLEFLREVDFLEKVPSDILESLVSKCFLKELKKGEVLFKDEQEGCSMYVILSGELVVSKNGTEIARRFKGDYIGEMSLVGSKPRSATVISALPSVLLEITQEQFHAQLSSSPDALLAIMKTLSDRARDDLKIFKTQDSGMDRTHKVQSQDKLYQNKSGLRKSSSRNFKVFGQESREFFSVRRHVLKKIHGNRFKLSKT